MSPNPPPLRYALAGKRRRINVGATLQDSAVYWDTLAPPADVQDATITEVDSKGAFGMVALSNGARFQNPPKPPQPLPPNFRQTADGRWKIRDLDEVRRIRLGDKRAEGRLSRLK